MKADYFLGMSEHFEIGLNNQSQIDIFIRFNFRTT